MSFLNNLCSWLDCSTIFLIILVSLLVHWLLKQRGLPPGPWGIPVLGYLPFLKGEPQHLAITRLGKKYGNVMSLYLGSILVIVLGDYTAINEAFVKQGTIFAGKPAVNQFSDDKKLKALTIDGAHEAIPHRRFILSSLRDFGSGKTSLEPQIMNEIRHFMDRIKSLNGQPINVIETLGITTANVICLFEFGKRYEYSDPKFQHLRNLINTSGKLVGGTAIRLVLPWIKYVPFSEKFTGVKQLQKIIDEFNAYFEEKIKDAKEHYVEGSRSDYITGYLTEQNEIRRKTGSEEPFDDAHLTGNLGALFGAGSETVVTTISWALVYILKYPETFRKVINEIDEVIGLERDPSLTDKPSMPYTEATIMEIHRMASVLPLSLVHGNTEETYVCGHRIPKNSYVLGNLWAVHHDKDLWGDPEEFRPERFFNDKGAVKKSEYLMPFSVGKRNCIGESLAQMEVFLYLTSILQHFRITLASGETLSTEVEFGITIKPKPFNICAVPRQ